MKTGREGTAFLRKWMIMDNGPGKCLIVYCDFDDEVREVPFDPDYGGDGYSRSLAEHIVFSHNRYLEELDTKL